MKLLFQNSLGEERIIVEVDSWTEACDEINKFLEEHNFTSHYKRTWFHNDRMVIDVGSHLEFFYLEPYSEEKWYKEQEMLGKEEVE